jgi:uncharacterized protein YcbK (DUF882 family)
MGAHLTRGGLSRGLLTRAGPEANSSQVVLSFRFALVVMALGGSWSAARGAQPEAEEPETAPVAEEPEQPPEPHPDAPGPAGETGPAGSSRSGPKAGGTKAGAGAQASAATGIRNTRGWVVPDDRLRKRLPPPPSGNVHLHNRYRQESLKVNIFNRDGSYNSDALAALSRLMRCKRTDLETPIEPRLFAILSHITDRFGERRIEVTSGYRNQQRTTSNHYRGSATDIHVQGVDPAELSAFVDSLDSGGMGVGLYPRGGFVHVDIRPPPSYRWIDYSPTDPDDPNRRPPAGWKLRKKRLQT